ncbi:MAG: DUF1552 domain-containing protein [Myxococcales bacterium]|nr:DUF1552 domain-containing protein [Myxococcales bacterium]
MAGAHDLSRRLFLKRAGQAALALPLLQLPRGARAQGQAFPKRFLVIFQPNGTKKELWGPQPGDPETGWSLGPITQPLAPFQDRLVMFNGLDNLAALEGPGGPHQRGMAALLTGQIIANGDFIGGDGRRAGWGNGISVDQHIAQRLNAGTALTSLELGVRVKEAVPRGRMIYRGPEQPVPPENDPVVAFGRVFGQMDGDPDDLRRMLRQRRSVLDRVFQDFGALERRVAAADREKLQQHAASLRDLEQRLGSMVDRPEQCRPGVAPSVRDPMSEAEYGALVQAQIDLMVSALACDVTRVGSLQFSTSVNALRFTFMGMNDYQGHSLSHGGDNNEVMQTQWEAMLHWYSQQMAYLLERLASVPEGDGTLLDNTLILWCNELSRGNTHNLRDLPLVLAGGAGGALRGGRHLSFDGRGHNDLLVSILHLMGVPQPSFGNPDFCAGPLPGLI